MIRKHRRRWVLGTLAGIYLFTMIFGGCADKLILMPQYGWIDAGTAQRQVIQMDGRGIEVWTARSELAQNREPEGFVLEFCGNATRAEQIAQYVAMRWNTHPIEAWVMNYPGYGGSDGPTRLALIPGSALAVFDELKKKAGDRPIFLEANSLGTAAALHVAAHRKVAGLVLQDPPPLRQLILRRHGWWNLWLLAVPVAMQIPSELDSPANARQVNAPAVFVLADCDEIVPPQYHKLVVDAYAGPKRTVIMQGCGHNDSLPGQAEKDLAERIEWLWNRGGGRGTGDSPVAPRSATP
jgi:pimeloyl-ACP methyl ester carboxylesterase